MNRLLSALTQNLKEQMGYDVPCARIYLFHSQKFSLSLLSKVQLKLHMHF